MKHLLAILLFLPVAALAQTRTNATLEGDNTFTGNNTFARDLVVAGNLTYTPGQDAILTFTVNATASAIAGNLNISLPSNNSIELIEDTGDYYWTDENYQSWQGRGAALPGVSAADVATGLRAWLVDYAAEFLSPTPAISGAGTQVVITYSFMPAPSGWGTSDASLVSLANTQTGSAPTYAGNPAAQSIVLYNESNQKLYRLRLTGSPNPTITLTEIPAQ